jgi:hypothetical protein
MRAGLVVAALVMAISSGCATAGSASSGTSKGTRSQDVIAEAEITSRAREATTALQVIEQLRPQMLRGRGVSSPSDVSGEATLPRVYVDEVSYGNLSTLSNVSAGQIKEIRFLNSRDATTRWGTGHMGGVILVTTMK